MHEELIAELQNEGKGQNNMSEKWISVAECLPQLKGEEAGFKQPSSSLVVFRTEDKTVHLGYVCQEKHCSPDGEEFVLDRWYDQRGEQVENVTCWMQLPA